MAVLVESKVFVRSWSMRSEPGEFMTLDIQLIVPEGFRSGDISKLNFSDVLQSPAVKNAIDTEIKNRARKISFTDR